MRLLCASCGPASESYLAVSLIVWLLLVGWYYFNKFRGVGRLKFAARRYAPGKKGKSVKGSPPRKSCTGIRQIAIGLVVLRQAKPHVSGAERVGVAETGGGTQNPRSEEPGTAPNHAPATVPTQPGATVTRRA